MSYPNIGELVHAAEFSDKNRLGGAYVVYDIDDSLPICTHYLMFGGTSDRFSVSSENINRDKNGNWQVDIRSLLPVDSEEQCHDVSKPSGKPEEWSPRQSPAFRFVTPSVGDWVYWMPEDDGDAPTRFSIRKILDKGFFKKCILFNGGSYYTIEESDLRFCKIEKRRSSKDINKYEDFSIYDTTVVPEPLNPKSLIVPPNVPVQTFQLLCQYMTLVRRRCRMLLEEHAGVSDGHLSEELGLFISADEISISDLISAGISDDDYKTLLSIARSANFVIHNPVDLDQSATRRKISELRQEADRLEKEIRGSNE